MFEIARKDGGNYVYTQANRDAYTGVKAFWMDTAKAKKKSVVVGVLGNATHLREVYATEADALERAKSEWQRLRRGQATMTFDLAIAKPELTPQCMIQFKDMKEPINSERWLIKQLTHRLDADGGLTTKMELETEGEVTELVTVE